MSLAIEYVLIDCVDLDAMTDFWCQVLDTRAATLGSMGGRGAMLASVAVLAASGFLPWLRSGQRERSGFEMVDAARTLDALDSAVARSLATALYLVPLAATLAWLAVVLDRPRMGATLALAAGSLCGLFAIGLERSPLTVLLGVRVAVVASGVTFVSGAVVLWKGRSDERAALEPYGA